MGRKRKALSDINSALKIIHNDPNACDSTQYTAIDPEPKCTAGTLTKLYEQRAQIYEDRRQFDRAAGNLDKAISLLSDLNLKLFSHDLSDSVRTRINSLYSIIGKDYIQARRYGEALSSYSRAIASPSYLDGTAMSFFKPRAKVEIILGQYAQAIDDLDSTGLDSKDKINGPEIFDYLTIRIAQRRFDGIDDTLLLHRVVNLEAGHPVVKFCGEPINKKRESHKEYRRIKKNDLPYSFFYYYKCISESLALKDYAVGIRRINLQLRKCNKNLFFPNKTRQE